VRGRVPLGVDSTACLVEAQQRDRAATATATPVAAEAAAGCPGSSASYASSISTSNSSESELRLQYAMAVVRMVNGIADSSQRGRVAASVASLASAAGESSLTSNGWGPGCVMPLFVLWEGGEGSGSRPSSCPATGSGAQPACCPATCTGRHECGHSCRLADGHADIHTPSASRVSARPLLPSFRPAPHPG